MSCLWGTDLCVQKSTILRTDGKGVTGGTGGRRGFGPSSPVS